MPRLRFRLTLLPVNWVFRWAGYAWLGVLAFGIYPPRHPPTVIVQAIGYALAGLALAGWLLLDILPRAMPHRAQALPVLFGVIVAATGFAAATGFGGSFLAIYGFVATIAAAGDCTLGAALGVLAAGILAVEVSVLLSGAGLAAGVGFPAIFGSGVMIGRNRASYRVQAEQSAVLLAQRERLEAERRRADVLDERARIAREIHDVLAHSLGALGIQIQAARSVLTDRGDIAQASELLAAAQRMAAEGLTETRRAVSALRTDALPLDASLTTATSTYAARYGVTVDMRADGEPRPVPADATVALLRVAQEALVNAAKHAAGQPVTVRLHYEASGITLTVRNPLAGGSTAGGPLGGARIRTADTGYGLTSMRERVRLLGGTLGAGPGDGHWTVTASLPLPPESRPPDSPSSRAAGQP